LIAFTYKMDSHFEHLFGHGGKAPDAWSWRELSVLYSEFGDIPNCHLYAGERDRYLHDQATETMHRASPITSSDEALADRKEGASERLDHGRHVSDRGVSTPRPSLSRAG